MQAQTKVPLNVLLCGASGFIGGHLLAALRGAGHRVAVGRSPAARASAPAMTLDGATDVIPMDFRGDTRTEDWMARLQGIDAVVNAVGVLRDTRARPMQAIHEDTPRALFEACARAGVRRVIHVSALGIEGNGTRYARTKLAADEYLLALNRQGRLDGVALRPSIVFGPGGDSARLFMMLARSPALLLPGAVLKAKVQPVAVQDLADAVPRLLAEASDIKGVLPCVGPAQLTLAGFIACLREQLGRPPARVGALPEPISRWSARFGDLVPLMPWCSETMALLAQDNVAEPELFKTVLGRPPVPPSALLGGPWS